METLRKKTLFWDVSLDDIDPEKNKEFIIERVLNKGDLEDFRWITEKYNKSDISNVIKNKGYRLDRKSMNFWCMYFNINSSDVRKIN